MSGFSCLAKVGDPVVALWARCLHEVGFAKEKGSERCFFERVGGRICKNAVQSKEGAIFKELIFEGFDQHIYSILVYFPSHSHECFVHV